VLVPGFVSQVELLWEEPTVARFLRRLTAFSRTLVFDKRGQGLSDRPGRPPTLEESMDDLKAVAEAAGFKRPALFGISEGGPMSTLYAATYPDPVSSLVHFGTFARMLKAPDFPSGIPAEALDRWGRSSSAIGARRSPSTFGRPAGLGIASSKNGGRGCCARAVSSTVRELLVGSGLEFSERGVEKLKGAPGEWRLFAIDLPPA
jgi:pimeloyl-ACP methyl ester carboxylesterase